MIFTVCCRYGHGQRSIQIRCEKNYENYWTTPQAKARNIKRRQRSSALPSRTWNSILTSCGNQLGNWIGIRYRPCTAFTLASPHSSSITPSLLSGHPWHPLPALGDGLIQKTPCGVVFIDAIEPTRCGGGVRARQLRE